MKTLLLITILLAIFAIGYIVMIQIDHFKKEQHYRIPAEKKEKRNHIRISAESPVLLDSISTQLKAHSRVDPAVKFSLKTESSENILQKLSEGTLDIALLTEAHCKDLNEPYVILRIPNIGNEIVSVVWNKSLCSKIRDDVLFTIEAEYCSLKCGYADYLQ